MAGRSAAKRTTPRRTSGTEHEGKASQISPATTTTVTTTGGSADGDGSTASGDGRWGQFVKFMAQVRVEAGRVTWPTKVELAQATRVTLFTLVVFMLYLGVLDWVFIKIFKFGNHR